MTTRITIMNEGPKDVLVRFIDPNNSLVSKMDVTLARTQRLENYVYDTQSLLIEEKEPE